MKRTTTLFFALALSLAVPRSLFAACTAKTLSCGQSITDTLSPSQSCIIDTFPTATYTFNGTAGQQLSLTATTASGNTIGLELYAPGNTTTPIRNDFDEPASFTVTLPATGTYTIQVNFGNPHNSGSFTITAACPTSTTTQCKFTDTVSIGQMFTGSLTSADAVCGDSTSYAKVYKLPVTAGDAFEVTYSATYAPLIDIVGPSSTTDKSEASHSSTTSSLTTSYVAPNTGNISLWLYSNTTTPVTGSFSVSIRRIELPACGKVRAVRH